MFDINLGVMEMLMFGAFILGTYIKNKIDSRTRNKTLNDAFQCSVHLGIALYTIYNINTNNNFNANLLQETNKMFSHYGKNVNDMVNMVKVKLEEYSEKNDKVVELYNKMVDNVKNTLNESDSSVKTTVIESQQYPQSAQYFTSNA